jgi:hypothetical protein
MATALLQMPIYKWSLRRSTLSHLLILQRLWITSTSTFSSQQPAENQKRSGTYVSEEGIPTSRTRHLLHRHDARRLVMAYRLSAVWLHDELRSTSWTDCKERTHLVYGDEI